MGRPNKYPDQFRKDALELVRTSKRPIAEVARSLGIAEGTLWNWVRAERDANAREGDPDALSESERDELRRRRTPLPRRRRPASRAPVASSATTRSTARRSR